MKDSYFICILLLLALPVFSIPAEAYENSQLQWAPGTSARLQIGEFLTYDGFTIEAVQFPAPVESDRYKEAPAEPVEAYVGLNISKNGIFIAKATLLPGDSYISPDGEFRVTAKALPPKNGTEWLYESYTPWAVIEVNPRGKPDIQVLIDTDEEKYISSPSIEIIATLQIENSGQADLTNIDVDIGTQLPLKRGLLKYHYDTISKGEAVTETITFDAPILQDQKTFKIIANISGYDVKGSLYNATSQKSIIITIEPERGLSLRKSTFSKLYLKDTAIMTVYLKNNGNEPINNITLKDSLPKEFKLIGNKTLNWLIDLAPGEEWTYRYLIKPVEANQDGIIFPSATADYMIGRETYGIRSNQPKVRVNGPRIMLSKKTSISELDINETENIFSIMVIAENTGNTPTKVFINDTLPENATIIEGNNTFETFLEAGKEVKYYYSVRVNSPPPITIPSANALYFELGTSGMKINTVSQELEIKVKVPPVVLPEVAPETNITEINESFNESNFSEDMMLNELSQKIDNALSTIFGCNVQNVSFVCDLLIKRKPDNHIPTVLTPNINLIANPGFEIGTDHPLNWIQVSSEGNIPVWDSVSHTGKRSMKISIPGTINSTSGYPQSDIIYSMPLENYTISAWIKKLNAGGNAMPAVRVVELDGSMNWIGQTILYFDTDSNDWTNKQMTFQTSSNTKYLYIYANIRSGYGTFWIDDISLMGPSSP